MKRTTPDSAEGGGAVTLTTGRVGLSELAADLFSLVLSLRVAPDIGDPKEVRQRIHQLLAKMEADAKKAGYASERIEDAKFALVGLLDEAILNSQWPGKADWRAVTLQQEMFRINTAGEQFFTRMEELRKNLDENRDVVEVYFDCLALGFEGRYKLFGRDKLDVLVGELSRDLARDRKWTMASLSPHWRRPDDFSEVVGEGVPVWVTFLFFVPGVILLILLFALYARAVAGGTADALQETLQRITG
jgi:type VI secretion system protein ImpK